VTFSVSKSKERVSIWDRVDRQERRYVYAAADLWRALQKQVHSRSCPISEILRLT